MVIRDRSSVLAALDTEDLPLLAGASLSGANLEQADLSGARLSKADLSATSLSFADFRQADLSGASLVDAELFQTEFDGARLSGTLWIDRRRCRYGSVGECE